MKKIIAILLSIITVVSLSACGNKTTADNTTNPSISVEESTNNTDQTTFVPTTNESSENTGSESDVETTTTSSGTSSDDTTKNNTTTTVESTTKKPNSTSSVTESTTQKQETTTKKQETTTKNENTTSSSSSSSNANDSMITVNNSNILVEPGVKVIAITKASSETTEKVKDAHADLFEEVKTNISGYCEVKRVTPILKNTESVDGSEAYYVFGMVNTEQLGRGYMISTTMFDGNTPYNFTAIYGSEMSLDEILDSMESDLDVLSDLLV